MARYKSLAELQAERKAAEEEAKRLAQQEHNKKVAQSKAKKTRNLPTKKQKAVESKIRQKKAEATKPGRAKSTLDRMKASNEARERAKKLTEGKSKFEASKAKAKNFSSDLFKKQLKEAEASVNRDRALKNRADLIKQKKNLSLANKTTVPRPKAPAFHGPQRPPSTLLSSRAKQAAAEKLAKQLGSKTVARGVAGTVARGLLAGGGLPLTLVGAAGSKAYDDYQELKDYQKDLSTDVKKVREGANVEIPGGFSGSGGNFARQIIATQRRGEQFKVPESEGLQKTEEHTPYNTKEQLRAKDQPKKEKYDMGSLEWLSETVTGDPYAFAKLAREDIGEQAKTALDKGTVKPANVGQQAVNNENQKRVAENRKPVTQEEATKIKADTERSFKEASFDGKQAILTALGVAAMAVAFKDDPVGAVNAIAGKLDAAQQAKLEAAAAASKQASIAKEKELDRQNALDIAKLRIKGTLEAARQKAMLKQQTDRMETQALSSSDAEDLIGSWAEENEIDITPDKQLALAQQFRSIYSKNPDAVGADPLAVVNKLAANRLSKQPTTLGFTPFTGEYKFQ